jgi:hypothetical protein
MKTSMQIRHIAEMISPKTVYIQQVRKYLEPINNALENLMQEFDKLKHEAPKKFHNKNIVDEEAPQQFEQQEESYDFTALRAMLKKIMTDVKDHLFQLDSSFGKLTASDAFKTLQTLKIELQKFVKVLEKNIFKNHKVYEMIPDQSKSKFDKLLQELQNDIKGLAQLDQREMEEMENLGAY